MMTIKNIIDVTIIKTNQMKQVIFKSPDSHRLLINKRSQNLIPRIGVS
jgi:hypothetical protein